MQFWKFVCKLKVHFKLQALFNIVRDEWEIICNEGARTVEK